MSYCRDCKRAYDRLRQRTWYLDKKRENGRRHYTKTADRKHAYYEAYKLQHQDKLQARSIMGHAIRDGKLLRRPCEVCAGKADGHHDDYARPLEVRWLCRQHHMAHHHEIPA